MKTSYLKFTTILLFISFLIVLGLPYCGQKESVNKTESVIDTEKQPEKIQAVTVDSQVAVPAEQVIKENKDITKNELSPDPAKEKMEADKIKVSVPEKKLPVPAEKKPDPVTVVQPSGNKQIISIDKIPDVDIKESDMPVQQKSIPKADIPNPVIVPNSSDEENGWVIMAKYRNMKSPYPVNNESMELGKSLFGTHCISCHGKKGEGNGPKAANIDTKIRSFLRAEFKEQSPGEVYYMSIVGRKDMPRFDKKIPDEEDQWAIVAYIMSLK